MTARLWLARGLNPADREAVLPVVAVDPDGDPAERAVARLSAQGYEGDGCLFLVRTDGWAERRLSDGTLTVSVAAYPADPDDADGVLRSARDPQAVLLLTVSAPVSALAYARATDSTVVVVTPEARSAGDIEADLGTGALWPLILAPPPSRLPEAFTGHGRDHNHGRTQGR
ncbi:hypothetical protein [Streptomyces sp. NPDC090022]|uniref:hypothetical protein n=1 Tax=Streptomyces sp. NPDC090022 TaxID=3365920 RepID=UPI0038156EDF